MPMPPWTRELFSGSVEEITGKLRRNESLRELQTKATDLLGELPTTAARQLERLLQESRRGAEQVRRWSRRQTSLSTAAINGSGVLFHPSLSGVPLRSDQIDLLSPSSDISQLASGEVRRRIATRLQSAIGSHVAADVAVARSTAAAASAIGAFAAARGWKVAVPRSAAMRLAGGRPLPEALAAGGCRVLEIGTPERCSAEDWQHAAAVAGEQLAGVCVEWPAASNRAGCSESGLGANPPYGRLHVRFLPLGAFGAVAGLSERWISDIGAAASDSQGITVVPGNRLLGGPESALILASADTIAAIRATPLWPALEADPPTMAALVPVLEQTPGPSDEWSPHLSMLQTSVENLQNRCERLAIQLVGSERVTTCEIATADASLVEGDGGAVPSRQLCVRRNSAAGDAWAERLAAESPALLVQSSPQSITIDIRWIPPSLDGELVRLLTELPSSELPGSEASGGEAAGGEAAGGRLPAVRLPLRRLPELWGPGKGGPGRRGPGKRSPRKGSPSGRARDRRQHRPWCVSARRRIGRPLGGKGSAGPRPGRCGVVVVSLAWRLHNPLPWFVPAFGCGPLAPLLASAAAAPSCRTTRSDPPA